MFVYNIRPQPSVNIITLSAVAVACGGVSVDIVNGNNNDLTYFCKYLPYRSDNSNCKQITFGRLFY